MSHQKYTTDAFIFKTSPTGEADRIIEVYTESFGTIRAVAKSVRLQKSKLKSSLEQGRLLNISIVKGKEYWRLTDARELKEKIAFPSESFNIFLKIIILIKSLVHGEEKNEKVFSALRETYSKLQENSETYSKEDISTIECITIVKILDALGYGHENESWGVPISASLDELLKEAKLKKKELVLLINKSLKESHLG